MIVEFVQDQLMEAPETTNFNEAVDKVAFDKIVPSLSVTVQLADKYEILFNGAVTERGQLTFACAALLPEMLTVAFLLTPPTPSNRSCAEPDCTLIEQLIELLEGNTASYKLKYNVGVGFAK